jgi:hypothetical protein
MDIKNEIIKTIELLIDKRLNSNPVDIPAVVLGTHKDKYKVNIDGADYYVKDGILLHPTIGTKVWVHCPNGKITEAYIAAKR